jgi:hypothetical protein
MTRNPWKEAFLSSNVKYILIACVVLIGQGVVGTAVSSGRCTFCSRFPRCNENAALKKGAPGVRMKISEKGAVSFTAWGAFQ